MTDITDAARAEVYDRHPVWRDNGVGIAQGNSYRSGFVAGAEWAEARSSAPHEAMRVGLLRAKEELAAARESLLLEAADAREQLAAKEHLMAVRESIMLEAAPPLTPMTDATRERLVLQIADIIDAAPIQISSEGQSIVGDPSALASAVLSAILAPGVVGFEVALQVSKAINERAKTIATMQFVDELPSGRTPRRERIDWADAKAKLIENEGQWGLMAKDVWASTIDQLRGGKYKDFRGADLDHFEFATRKPENPQAPYGKRRTDLWGRYNGNAP